MTRRLIPLACALLALAGLFLTPHYGESWDELNFYKYADHALQSYWTALSEARIIVHGNTYDNYGPAFVMFNALTARALHGLFHNLLVSDLRHFVYFVFFLAGVYAFHVLARRWMSRPAAWAATLLFLTQPVIWGQAFISPKDVPFLNALLISLWFGLRMVDARPTLNGRPPRALLGVTAVWLLSLCVFFLTPRFLDEGLASVIRGASASPQSLTGLLLRRVFSDFGRADVEIYVTRGRVALLWFKLLYLLLSTGWVWRMYHDRFPSALSLLNRATVPAALALGLTTSIRILGPLAAVLVVIYAWQSMGRRALPMLFLYAGTALAVTLITWPYLWPDPPARFLESLRVMSQYPWRGQVLFNGHYYPSTALPRTYLPVLLLIQLTEPFWLLFAIGLSKLRKQGYLLLLFVLWTLLPLSLLIAMRSPLYDNFRQVLFTLPPLFFVAGLGVEALLRRLTRPLVRIGCVVLMLLPGLMSIVYLHPYEYVYYNSFIGGLRGARGRFELEYWATSYREAIQYLNVTAAANAKVLAAGPAHIAALYARPDLKILSDNERAGQALDYAILTARYDLDQREFPQAEIIRVVERGGVNFAVIKRIGASP